MPPVKDSDTEQRSSPPPPPALTGEPGCHRQVSDPERARRINSTRVFIAHVRPRRRQPATSPPMLTSPSSPLAAHPSLPACHLPPPSRQAAVPPSYRPTTRSSSVLSKKIFFPFCPFPLSSPSGHDNEGFHLPLRPRLHPGEFSLSAFKVPLKPNCVVLTAHLKIRFTAGQPSADEIAVPATDTAPPAVLALEYKIWVACQAPSCENTPLFSTGLSSPPCCGFCFVCTVVRILAKLMIL